MLLLLPEYSLHTHPHFNNKHFYFFISALRVPQCEHFCTLLYLTDVGRRHSVPLLAGGFGRRPHLSEVGRPCVCFWDYITTPERGLPDRHAQCNTSRGKASEPGSETPGFRDARGVAPSSPLSCYVLTQMGRVNRTGVKPCGRSILMEQNLRPLWIRLMPACGGREGAGVSARPSPTGVDRLGLCRWLMVA